MIFNINSTRGHTGSLLVTSVLARIWIFFPKKELLKKIRELFAKERSYPSTTKLHDKARKQVRNLYITCTKYTKKIYRPSSIINYVIIWSTCKWLILEEKMIFVTEKDVICIIKIKNKIFFFFFFFFYKKTVISTRKRRYNNGK